MKQSKTERRLINHLFIVVFYFISSVVFAADTNHSDLKNNPFLKPLLDELQKNQEQATLTEEEKKAQEQQQREQPDIVVKAIVVSGNQAIANINDELVRVGDEVSGYEILNITEGHVYLKKHFKKYVATIRGYKEISDDK